MARLVYAIIRADGCWRVVCERRRIGRYATCESAALAAMALAREAVASDHDVEVLVQDAGGQLWPVARLDAAAICAEPEEDVPATGSGRSAAS
ncbi:hypothetical protein [Brevundimonas sp.]|uniref:hypothetical protein n=1 Tax=Brevundimonas sp. TaxID=1871086 RepID=UPI002737A32D|nr:hypothetical protein [Brevundimonas sp.]MDP3803804.1 hypothetical protein [Brevundimonas sp.]